MTIGKSKTALVLAGGGLTGAVYEIGALRAIDDLLIDRTVNDFDIYVGTSAGALVAAFISVGVSPEEMLRVIDGTHPSTRTVERGHIFNLDVWNYIQWGFKLPLKLTSVFTQILLNIGDMTTFDLFWSLSETLPAGLYNPAGLEKFVSQGLNEIGKNDIFQDLNNKLFITATDLDTGKRAIFGPGYIDAPISKAVSASAAFPMVYKPVRVGKRDFIDGGTRGNASIDLAVEHGATLIVVINPLVPIDYENRELPCGNGSSVNHISDKGVQSIASQVFRILLHSGLHYHIKQIRRSHPEVDIILIEPSCEDSKMFSYNIMRYSARLTVARHGFQSVSQQLSSQYRQIKEILDRHQIPITLGIIDEEIFEFESSGFDPGVVRDVLEAKNNHFTPRQRRHPLFQLNRALNELEFTLDQFCLSL